MSSIAKSTTMEEKKAKKPKKSEKAEEKKPKKSEKAEEKKPKKLEKAEEKKPKKSEKAEEKKPKKLEKSQKTSKKPDRFQFYNLVELKPGEIMIDDVLDALNKMVFWSEEFSRYSFDLIDAILAQLIPGGVAAELVIYSDTFKVFVKFLRVARFEVDYRLLKHYWPLFHQLFLHLSFDDLNAGIAHFLATKELYDSGNILDKKKPMHETFPGYGADFSSLLRNFLIGDAPVAKPIDEEYRQNCKKFSYCLMLHPKWAITRAITTAIGASDTAVDNLIKFFWHVPAFLRHTVEHPNIARKPVPLLASIVHHIAGNELNQMKMELKAQKLLNFCHKLTIPCEIIVKEVKPPLMEMHEFGDIIPKLQAVLLQGSV